MNPPKILPLSDLASSRVGAMPAACYLKSALWKLYWLALKINRDLVILLLSWLKITPNLANSVRENTGDDYLNSPVMVYDPPVYEDFHTSLNLLIVSLFFSRKVTALGENILKSSMGSFLFKSCSISQRQLSATPPISILIIGNYIIRFIVSSFCSNRDSALLTLAFSLKINLKSSAGYVWWNRIKLRWLSPIIRFYLNESNYKSNLSLSLRRVTSNCTCVKRKVEVTSWGSRYADIGYY